MHVCPRFCAAQTWPSMRLGRWSQTRGHWSLYSIFLSPLSLSLSLLIPLPLCFSLLRSVLSLSTLHHFLVSPFSLSISFSLHRLSIFYSNILNPTLHFLSLSPFFLPRPYYLFFLLSHPHPDTIYFSKFFKSFEKSLLIQTHNVTVLQYNCALTCCTINQIPPPFSCIAFHSLSSGKVVWCL